MAEQEKQLPPPGPGYGEVHCCVCKCFLHYIEGMPDGEITHGYCRKHYEEVMAQVDAMIEARKKEEAQRSITSTGLTGKEG